jgi:hypothetical protein
MQKIRIKNSETMTEYSETFNTENNLLRIPNRLRNTLGLSLNQVVPLMCNNGEKIELKVALAYKEDIDEDEGLCYVTRPVFEMVNVEKSKDYGVKPYGGVTLGCDPEFFLVDKYTNKLLRAYMFMGKWGEIGHDGILAELRPRPSHNPEGLTDNIYQLIRKMRERLNTNNIYDPNRIGLHGASGFYNSTAGFHLHFGLPRSILGYNRQVKTLMRYLVRILDFYVGIPSVIVEDDDFVRRTNVGISYGKPSDFRLDNRTLEYRVPGGVMLKHPVLTKGLISLGSLVINDVVSKMNYCSEGFRYLHWFSKETRFEEFYPDILNNEEIYRLICCPNVERAKQYLDKIYFGLSNMISFDENKEAIDSLFYTINNNIKYTSNIEHNWRSYYETKHNELHCTVQTTTNCSRS